MTKYYRIKAFSELTSVTLRTLHYYDEIGLLKPATKSVSGHRLYSENDLFRLQQITTLKFMGFKLTAIKTLLQQSDFNINSALNLQAEVLTSQARHIEQAARLIRYTAGQLDANQAVNWYSIAKIINILETSSMSTDKQIYSNVEASELGKKSTYDGSYNPDKLFSIPRNGKRQEIGIDPDNLPFHGFDLWNHYEVSWLNDKGKPVVAIAEIYYDCHSPNIVESKSLKLYFNSFNNVKLTDKNAVEKIVQKDLAERVGAEIIVNITTLDLVKNEMLHHAMTGLCLDRLDINCTAYLVDPSLLTVENNEVTETVYSDLLKSNCLVTNQPDWGSVQISYTGKQINHVGLLQYIVSFRHHNEFHEQCIERIFADIMKYCEPTELTVYGRYTRRGGLDINPYRSTKKVDFNDKNQRLCRQ